MSANDDDIKIHLSWMAGRPRHRVQVRFGTDGDAPLVRPPATIVFGRDGKVKAVATPSSDVVDDEEFDRRLAEANAHQDSTSDEGSDDSCPPMKKVKLEPPVEALSSGVLAAQVKQEPVENLPLISVKQEPAEIPLVSIKQEQVKVKQEQVEVKLEPPVEVKQEPIDDNDDVEEDDDNDDVEEDDDDGGDVEDDDDDDDASVIFIKQVIYGSDIE